MFNIIGLEDICREYGLQNKDVAEMIGVSPGTFNDWLSGRRKIPELRLKQLSELKIFKGIPIDYFSRELKQHERLSLESIKIINEYNLIMNEDMFVDTEGNLDDGVARHLQFNEARVEFLKAIEKLKDANLTNWRKEHEDWIDLMNYHTEAISLLAEIFSRDNDEEKQKILELLRSLCFIITNQEPITLDIATHWIPTKIEPYCVGRITMGKPYQIYYDETQDEYFMIDDVGDNTVWFLTVEGRYAIIP